MNGRILGASGLIGAMTGVRSTAGAAVVAAWLFPRRRITTVLQTAFLGEVIADKLPFVPPRTAPLPFVGRLLLATVAGASAARRLKGPVLAAGSVAALAASCTAVASTHGRRVATEHGVPDLAMALGEDALVLAAGSVVLRLLER